MRRLHSAISISDYYRWWRIWSHSDERGIWSFRPKDHYPSSEAQKTKQNGFDLDTKRFGFFYTDIDRFLVILSEMKTEPNQSLQTTIRTVTECAPSRTFRASADRV